MKLKIPSAPWALLLLALPATMLALTGCDAVNAQPVAIFRPESPQATAIHDLSLTLLGIAAVAFVIVEVWLFAAIFRFRNRPEELAVQTHGNLPLEIGWTTATGLVVMAVLAMTVKTMLDVTALPGPVPNSAQAAALPLASAFPGDTIPVRVIGHQWWWTFEFPTLNIVTGNEIQVPLDKTIKVQVESDDVNHSFWVPRLGPKIDAIPGQINYTSFMAIQQGDYLGQCAEFCGAEHARMGFRITAVKPEEFSAWVRDQQAPAGEPVEAAQKAGAQLFQQSCAGCHTVRGTQAQGKTGPDLTHFARRKALAAETLDNMPENLAKWLRDPQEVKPENKMPNLHLDSAAVDHLVAYLESLQ